MKKRVSGLFVLMIAIIFISISFISSASSCEVVLREDCNSDDGEHIVMGVSAITNAHGEKATDGGYDYVLCCGFGTGDTNCTTNPPNKIIRLSAETNAHAEVPSGTTYDYDVCYEDLECTDSSGSCPAGKSGLLSLTDTTNAHIGNFSDYDIKICCSSQEYSFIACDLNEAYWSWDQFAEYPLEEGDEALDEQRFYLAVKGENCAGIKIDFNVTEDDEGPASTPPNSDDFERGIAAGEWDAEYINDGVFDGNPEYYFDAFFLGSSKSMRSSGPLLTVTDTSTILNYCNENEVAVCKDYDEEKMCVNDPCDISSQGVSDSSLCDDEDIDCVCLWQDGSCNTVMLTPFCGNGIIENTEQCDSDSWGDITNCSDLGYTGGELSCNNNCQFNVSQCTGLEEGVCGNDVQNTGEQCDGNSTGGGWPSTITDCSSFDEFTGGNLTCNSPETENECQFDTSQCIGDGGDLLTLGKCTFQATGVDDDCSDGILSYSWTASWSGEEANKPSWCKDGSKTVPCPAQIELPFFSIYTLIAAIGVIVLVYLIINSKRKNSKKKKNKKSSKKKSKKKKSSKK